MAEWLEALAKTWLDSSRRRSLYRGRFLFVSPCRGWQRMVVVLVIDQRAFPRETELVVCTLWLSILSSRLPIRKAQTFRAGLSSVVVDVQERVPIGSCRLQEF